MIDLYAELAKPLNAACPADFDRAWIDAEVGDDWDDQSASCEGPSGKLQPTINASDSFTIGRKLRELRREMTQPGMSPWSRCTFTLFPDGKFKFDVSYED